MLPQTCNTECKSKTMQNFFKTKNKNEDGDENGNENENV